MKNNKNEQCVLEQSILNLLLNTTNMWIHVDTRFIQKKVILYEDLSQIFHLVNALDYGTLLVEVLSFVLPDEKVLLYHDFQH